MRAVGCEIIGIERALMQKIAKSVHGLVRDLVERVPPPTGYVWLREGSDCSFDVVFRLSLSIRRFGSLERGDLVRVPILCCPKNCILRSQISLRKLRSNDPNGHIGEQIAYHRTIPQKSGPSHFDCREVCQFVTD